MTTTYLDHLARQLKTGMDPACWRAIERILVRVKRKYEESEYTCRAETERALKPVANPNFVIDLPEVFPLVLICAAKKFECKTVVPLYRKPFGQQFEVDNGSQALWKVRRKPPRGSWVLNWQYPGSIGATLPIL